MKDLVFVAAVILILSCDQRDPKPARTSVPEHATELDVRVATGTAEAHVTCVSQVTTPCQYPDFEVDVVASVLDRCLVTPNGLSLAIDLANNAGQGIVMQLDGYERAGRYALDDREHRWFSLVSTTVNPRHAHQPAPPETCAAPGLAGASLTSPDNTCQGCEVTVTDGRPSAAFPKELGFAISCPNLCQSDTQVCTNVGGGDIDVRVRVPCTMQQ